jgi:hypothetical protein
MATFLVASCTVTSPSSQRAPVPDQKHILSVVSTDNQIQEGLAKMLAAPAINVYPQHKNGGYTLEIAKKQATLNNLSKPTFFGVLSQETRPSSFVISYNLRAFNGEIITNGEIVSIGEEQTFITPSLSHEANITPSVLEDIAKQLQPVLQQYLAERKWQAVVVANKDYRHIIIQSGEYEGVKIGDMFTSDNGASLQVVTFENGRAVLTVLEGLLPPVGSLLSLSNT